MLANTNTQHQRAAVARHHNLIGLLLINNGQCVGSLKSW